MHNDAVVEFYERRIRQTVWCIDTNNNTQKVFNNVSADVGSRALILLFAMADE